MGYVTDGGKTRQEGKGNLRAQILKLGEYAREQSLGTPPVQVFDREGDGLGFFSQLVRSRTPFLTHRLDCLRSLMRSVAR